MTLTGLSPGALGAAFAGGAAILVALYLLKQQRRRVQVPFAGLWTQVLGAERASAPWRRLRRLLSLLLQLAILGLLLAALADPRLGDSGRGRSVVFLVDTSASMQATDGAPGGSGRGQPSRTRLAVAQAEARRLVRAFGPEDVGLVMSLDDRPAPLSGFHSEEAALLDDLDRLSPSDAPADLARGLQLAADALRGHPRPTLVLIGDGAYDPELLARIRTGPSPDPRRAEDHGAQHLGGADLRGVEIQFVPVGSTSDNLAITAFAVRRYRRNRTAYEVLLELRSFFTREVKLRLELLQDGEAIEVESLTLRPGEVRSRVYPNLAGEGARLEARLGPVDGAGPLDALPLDDHAYAVVEPRRKLSVLLVSPGNLFLEGALLLDENLAVTRVAPGAWDPAAARRFDAVVLDGYTPAEPPPAHALYLDPRGPHSPFPIVGELTAPYLTQVAAAHPLTRFLSLKDLNVSRASAFRLGPGEVAIASSVRSPIIAAREREGRKTVALGFDLRHSDLPLRVAFPVLVVNALDWFAGGDAESTASLRTGHTVQLPVDPGAATLDLRRPDGTRLRVPAHEGRAPVRADRSGYWRVDHPGGAPAELAVNLADPEESRIAPRATLALGGHPLPPAPAPRLRIGLARVLWPYLALLALVALLLEWWSYQRRVTV